MRNPEHFLLEAMPAFLIEDYDDPNLQAGLDELYHNKHIRNITNFIVKLPELVIIVFLRGIFKFLFLF